MAAESSGSSKYHEIFSWWAHRSKRISLTQKNGGPKPANVYGEYTEISPRPVEKTAQLITLGQLENTKIMIYVSHDLWCGSG